MYKFLLLLASTALGLVALAPAASAQDGVSNPSCSGGDCCADLEERVAELEATTVRKARRPCTWFSLGGGPAFLTLPDTKFTLGVNADDDVVNKQTNLDFSEYGGGLTASIEHAIDPRFIVGVEATYARLRSDKTTRCESGGGIFCAVTDIVDKPGIDSTIFADTLTTHARKEVDTWGTRLSLQFNQLPAGAQVFVPPITFLFRQGSGYVNTGFDFRGIDQDLTINGRDKSTDLFRYNETVDTTYYGGFVSFGGELKFGLPGTGGLWERFGLRTFFEAQAGIYDAHTDYDGRFTPEGFDTTKLDLSQDKAAFIGGIKFNTVKQIGPRTSLSWESVYEWISSVPDMRYNDNDESFINGNNGTNIGSDSAFSYRGIIKVKIGLGPRQLYVGDERPHRIILREGNRYTAHE